MNLLNRAPALLSALIGMVIVAAALVLVPVPPAQATTTVYSVPTSSAGLGRIVTAPNGDMWFIEKDANKIGRITAAGAITEFALPATDSDVDGPAKDLDVSPDGSIWVITEHGSNLTRLSSTGTLLNNWVFPNYDECAGDTCPYGGAVRVAPDGVAWVTMNYGSSFIVKVTPDGQLFAPANAPACDDVLGEAADGSMWCQGGEAAGQNTIVHVNADAAGGVTYPLPSDATYPNALTAGPVASIWFTRSSSGTFITSPNNGSVGYLDQANGATSIWQTGSRTAPQDLVKAPDGTMWFTNAGAAPGIGHITSAGVGAITAVGNYEPTSLTWGADGAIWFTDAKNNSIVRVTTDQLQTTNIDLGTGVTMTSPAVPTPPVTPPTPGTPPAPGTQGLPTGAVAKPSSVVKVQKLKIPVKVTCPATSTRGCIGSLRVSVGRRAVTKKVSYRLGSGTSTVLRVKVTAAGKKSLRPGKKVKVRAALTPVGAKKPGTTRTFTVIRNK